MFDKKLTTFAPFAASAVLILALGGCAMISDKTQNALNQQEMTVKPANIYDSEDAAVVVKKDAENKTIQLQNISTSKRYTLNYGGTTRIFDKNGVAMSMPQLKEGSVVTVRFYKPDKSLSYVKENEHAFSYVNAANYALDLANGKLAVGKDNYLISRDVVVSSGGKETEPLELNAVDVISIWGYQDRIYGINVEKGHGYLRLKNDDYFIDGWLDVGGRVIRKIEDGMLLVVPEGTYTATVSNKGSSAAQQISFERGQEMVWDLGSVEIKRVQTGQIIFTLTPAAARIAIDNKEVDASKPVELTYGLHSMRIVAEGYESLSQYIKVAEPSANISVELEKKEEQTKDSETKPKETQEAKETKETADDGGNDSVANKKYDTKLPDGENSDGGEKSESNETKSGGENTGDVVSASNKYKVSIDAPEGVEAYLDGSYIGVTPISFAKSEGSHVVTLRKTGYQTRSYTLQIDGEQKDVNYSFTELLKLD